MTHRLTLLLSLGCLLLSPLSASAMEILTLDTGTFRISGANAFINASGPRLSITGAVVSSIFTAVPCLQGGCLPGTQALAGWLDVDWGGGVVNLDGTPHPVCGAYPNCDGLGLALSVDFTVPSPVQGSKITLTFPFTMVPFAEVLTRFDRFDGPNGAFGYVLYGLQGAGHVDVTLVPAPDGQAWLFQEALWELQPIPEPATLLLWGTGAASVGLARWWKRRRPA